MNAALAAFLGSIGTALAAYFARYGVQIVMRGAPLLTGLVGGLLLYFLIMHLDANPWVRYGLAAGVVMQAIASFSMGFEVRGEIPAAIVPTDVK